MTRHEEREAALMLLYQLELNSSDYEEILETNTESFELETNASALRLVKGVGEKKEEIDEIIARFSTTRSVQRIPKVNLTIMRMAIYEMLLGEIPDKVAINEAIELSKEYADKQDSSFISGLLGSYYREKNNEQI